MSATPTTPTTTTIDIFDPPMCCSTGVCGTDPNPDLARIAADLKWLGEQGVEVRRHNLSQEPEAFVSNVAVKRLLDDAGTDGLPAIVVDGEVIVWGEYPSRERLAQIAGLTSVAQPASAPKSGDGALDDRTAALIALAAAVVADSEPAIHHHHRQAIEMGISSEEMIEALNVALHVKGQAAQSTVRAAQKLLVPESAQGGCCGGGGGSGGGCGCG